MKVWFITGANVQGGSISQALEAGQELLKKYNIEAEHLKLTTRSHQTANLRFTREERKYRRLTNLSFTVLSTQ